MWGESSYMRYNRFSAVAFLVLLIAALLPLLAATPAMAQSPAGIPGFTLVKYVCPTNLSNTGNSVPAACVHAPDPNGANVPVIAPGGAVSFLYQVAYTCTEADPVNCPPLNPSVVTVADNRLPGVIPSPYGQLTGNGDGEFNFGETWLYVANNRTAANLATPLPTPAVAGCAASTGGQRPTMNNTASVTAPYSSNTDTGAYCNPPTPTPSPTGTPTPRPTPGPVPIPEPVTVVLFGTGLAALSAAVAVRRKKDD